MEKAQEMTTRFPAENIEVGPFVAKVDFHPETGAAHAIMIWRKSKSSHELDDMLHDLSIGISRVMQRKP